MGNTVGYYTAGNFSYRDKRYSSAQGVSIWESCPQLVALDPGVAFTFFDDFFSYFVQSSNHVGWTQTAVGSATVSVDDAAGGILKIVNSSADNDSVEIQNNGEYFKLVAGKPIWFEARVKASDATQSDLFVGLIITDTTINGGVSDGVYFRKDDGDANIDFCTEKNATETNTDTGADLAADTWVKLGFFFDGAGSVMAYVDGVLKATHTTNVCDDEELAVSFAFQNGEAVAKTGYIDYAKCVQIR